MSDETSTPETPEVPATKPKSQAPRDEEMLAALLMVTDDHDELLPFAIAMIRENMEEIMRRNPNLDFREEVKTMLEELDGKD